ncbi:MAG TPA: nucleotidyl transferase AbiEii/AbiGii toxin family protein [Thermoplasmata archaeon]|nr:nucleotidyl transferase AbiEii/AbiGii toxin family protein [Thermoplasmata archaeon]
MPTGPTDPVWVRSTAQKEGFQQDAFEKAWRLAHFLGEIATHPLLGPRLVLKGGTCINFFHAPLPRLSVDLDVNYVGNIERERMLQERPLVKEAIKSLATEHGYRMDEVADEHAGWSARFLYKNTREQTESIKVDVNYLMRLTLFGVEEKELPSVLDLDAPRIRCLATEDVYGGKLKALAVRAAPRDLYDAAAFYRGGIKHDPARLRKAFLFYCYTDDATLSTVNLKAVRSLGSKDLREGLYPMLRQNDRPDPEELLGLVIPELQKMLELESDEREFGSRLEKGMYEPELLFGPVEVSDRIRLHPAAEWRRRNPHGRLPGEP